MYLKSFRVENFRRLRDVRVDLDCDTSTFVGANNSGKTSATHVFQLFLGKERGAFQLFDFTSDCWPEFNEIDTDGTPDAADFPAIALDLWFQVDDLNTHRVVDLLPSLDWAGEPVGVRLRYEPRVPATLLERFTEAKTAAAASMNEDHPGWKPWPQSLTEYLTKRLNAEYEIKYYVLDYTRCDPETLKPNPDYEPFLLGNADSGAARLLDSLLQVDFLNAQRHLSDTDSQGRYEELSRRLSRFYVRNLEQRDADVAALSAIADSEKNLNAHYADVFQPTLDRLSELGYPGLSNPGLVVKATLDAGSVLRGSARVHYSVTARGATTPVTLPDRYNGLGFKNLIYMVIELLDFHHAWLSGEGEHAPVHLVMIEEPEVHLHAQLQQVFIRKIREVIPEHPAAFVTQLIVTTHSPHIMYERAFSHIRYFRKGADDTRAHHTEVRNLSVFYENEEKATREFLTQYLKLTHCDLFFADAAVLVEGNVERLLLPLMIAKAAPELRACHLTILELGGAFAHKFERLMSFLGIPTLIITDLDSVAASTADGEATDTSAIKNPKRCMTSVVGAVTSNETLRQWAPKKSSITDLLSLSEDAKTVADEHGTALVRVAYQTARQASWGGASAELAGRTLEEAFALENLEWCQAGDQQVLGLRIAGSTDLDVSALHTKIYERVGNLDKTRFALGVIAVDADEWRVPTYIAEGLKWLADVLLVKPGLAAEPAEGPPPAAEGAET